jgi:uncharacterized protein YndB with AHSA1/START domain
MSTETDRIEKKILLRAPRGRVWRALTDASEFGSWFGMKLDGPFTPGAVMRGAIKPTTVDPEVARMQKPHEGAPVELTVEEMEPERRFSFRWHPYAIDRSVDYSAEPTTLVAFELTEADGGILLTVTESGFDRIPIARRAQAFAANDGGWSKQMELIEGYLGKAT